MSKDGDNNEPSIDDIVASIRRIISDEETKTRRPPPPAPAAKTEDILELTNMLNDDGTVTPLPRPAPPVDASQPAVPFADAEDEAPIYAAPKPADGPRIINRPPPPRMGAATDDRPPAMPSMAQVDLGTQPQPSPPPVTRVAAPMTNNNSTTGSGVTLTPVAPQPGPAVPSAPPPSSNPVAPNLASPQTVGAAASAFDRLTQAALQQNAPPPPQRPAGPPIGGKSVEDLTREMLRPMLQQWIDANLPSMVERLVQQEIQRLARR